MKILFTLLSLPKDIKSGGMYLDMTQRFAADGHKVTIIAGSDCETTFKEEIGMMVLRVHSLPILYVKNLIKKGVGMALLPWAFKRAYKKYLKDETFDWIVMPTPPITLIDVVKHIKKKSGAKLYMVLRDIHPQSSASLGEIKFKWMVNYLYRRSDLGYRLSDVVGCMSPANITFIQKEHKIPASTRCTVLYNWMNYHPYVNDDFSELRTKYNLEGKYVVLFGGNLGLGQCVENIADLANHYLSNDDIRFVVIGKGVKKDDLHQMAVEQNLTNMIFMDFMPREDYLRFVKSADLGLISIHGNNAAPTCPSKALSYMSLKIPILALINKNNDYGQILEEKAKAGYWAVASDKERVYYLFDKLYCDARLRKEMGENGYRFFCENLTTDKVYAEMIRQMTA
jgi:glycosyltransferase involved in cell wall biosynthesis